MEFIALCVVRVVKSCCKEQVKKCLSVSLKHCQKRHDCQSLPQSGCEVIK